MFDSLDEHAWLYRGVPAESPEVGDVEFCAEVVPRRPDRSGPGWRRLHSHGDTETAFTSWTTDRSFAETAALAASQDAGLSGRITIFRVRVAELDLARVFEGRSDEFEFLLEGVVEGVEISEEEHDDDE